MFQALTNESKEGAGTTSTSPVHDRHLELHPPSGIAGMEGALGIGGKSGAAPVRQQIAGLQRTIGNQAVLRMLSRPGPVVQPKLTINQPGDQYEQEADRVAEQVMRMPDPEAAARLRSMQSTGADLQRKCAGCEEQDKLQRKETGTGPETAPLIVHQVLASPGQPLDAEGRAFFEPRFGCEFSQIRIHTDTRAAESAKSVGALAYTVGSNIAFARGRYAPDTAAGRRLLGHELTHVLQQSQSAHTSVGVQKLASPDTLLEREADHVAETVTGQAAKLVDEISPAPSTLQRVCQNGIGSPSGCIGVEGDVVGDHFLFEVGCDDFRAPPKYPQDEEARLRLFAATVSSGDSLDIHGFASEEGNATSNNNLSCARSIKAQSVLNAEFILAGKAVSSALFEHGATAGNREERRSVYIDWHPASPASSPTPLPTAPACASFPCLGTHRCLTGPEVATAVSVFGSSLDLTRIRISDSLGAGGAPWTNFSFSPTNPLANGTCLNLGGSFSNATLIHELTHSWQSQHHVDPTQYMVNSALSQGLSIALHGDRGCAYKYPVGAPFGDYGAEQIAEMVEDHFGGASGLAGYISIISGTPIGAVSGANVASLSLPRVGPPPCL
jgi:uncharacterized protein DUF4157